MITSPGGVSLSAVWLRSVPSELALTLAPGDTRGRYGTVLPAPPDGSDVPVTLGHPDPAVDPAAARNPRTPPHGRARDDGELNAIALARVRESATRNAAAAELFEAGRYDEAVPLFQQALASCRSTLGAEHPDTLTVAGNLGVAYVAAGQRRRGLRLIAVNLADRVRVLGEDHPATLTARNALAVAHRRNGDADTAIRLAKQVVLQRSRALGAAHVDTLTSRVGLAVALASAGEVTSAHRLLASAVNDAETTLGPDHEHTAALVACGEANGLLRREVP
jgi:tetratricopeptide (TPR) repeat protein